MKVCKKCGKVLSGRKRRNTYCSLECCNNEKREEKIKSWLGGDMEVAIKKDGRLSDTVRNYLLNRADYRCEVCGWGERNRFSESVPLEVHHIDGNYLNNHISNLKVLCPNCHSLTPNYRALNVSLREQYNSRKAYCIDCGAEISPGSLRCRECFGRNRITIKPLSREELKYKIRTLTFTEIGKEQNVTDNAIRKWCIKYNLPSKKRVISSYTDEEWEAL